MRLRVRLRPRYDLVGDLVLSRELLDLILEGLRRRESNLLGDGLRRRTGDRDLLRDGERDLRLIGDRSPRLKVPRL